MKEIAKCIEKGYIPITNDFHKVSWDSYNLYRTIDASNV